ncbi:MAG: hypothetical protein LBM13_02695 [Candidatus Ancillula sp.]|jgi:hypothetical protein|nr:hypothetical protein [Candidatus Ancillula sp.]
MKKLFAFLAGAAVGAAAVIILNDCKQQDEEWQSAWDSSSKPVEGVDGSLAKLATKVSQNVNK